MSTSLNKNLKKIKKKRLNSDKLYKGLPCVWGGGKYILFSPYSFQFARLSAEELNNSDVDNRLKSLNFYGKPSSEILNSESIKVTLLVTTDCNLRCKYCYMAAGKNKKYMTPQLAIEAIRGMMMEKPNAKEIHITFFGGEPTLNMEVIKRSVKFVKSAGLKYKFHISTNGIFSEKTLNYLLENYFDVTISLDGSSESNDTYRIFPDGTGTSKRIEKTINELVKRKSHFNVRMTITESNVRNIPLAIQYFSSLGTKFVHLEPINEDGRAKKFGIKPPDYENYLKYLIHGIKVAEKKNVFIINSALMNLLTPSEYFCISAKGEMYVITPEGEISLCYQVHDTNGVFSDFIIGKVTQNGLKINPDKLRKMQLIDVNHIEACKECFAKYICGSGCPRRNLITTGSLYNVSPSVCKIRKQIIREAIKQLYESSKYGKISPFIGAAVYENFI